MTLLHFYLYPEDPERFTVFGRELYRELAALAGRTHDPDRADVFICTHVNERNYPKYGDLSAAGGVGMPGVPAYWANLEHLDRGPHLVFHHAARDAANIETVVYSAPATETSRIIMPPPAIADYRFSDGPKRYRLSFKGRTTSGGANHRGSVFGHLRRYHDGERVVMLSRSEDTHDYDDLMCNSDFLLVVEGDQPWSYRLTEAVNAGGIPVIVEPHDGDSVLPFKQLLDYSKFAFVLPFDALDEFFEHEIHALPLARIESMRRELAVVNERYFASRACQVRGVLETLQRRVAAGNG